MDIKTYLKDHRLLTDGAMGTYFDLLEQEDAICSEEMNLVDPNLIEKIHMDYIKSGAQLIRSNTFMANRDVLEKIKLKRREFKDITLNEFIKKGYAIAKKAVDQALADGRIAFPAADIGPIAENQDWDHEDVLKQYEEICDAFLEAGCKIFVLETFPDEDYVLHMASYIRQREADAWILGQFTFMPTGYGSTGLHYSMVLTRAIESGKLDAVGLNCGIGAFHMENFLGNYLAEHNVPEGVEISALPNCGYPQIVRGKVVYSDSVPYFSNKVKEIASQGIKILGGCCGTNPDYIASINQWIHEKDLVLPQKVIVRRNTQSQNQKKQIANKFYEKLQAGEKVFAVELDPPFDADCSKLMSAAKTLIGTKTDIITIADSPLARSRADSLLMAAKIKHESGMDVMPHVTSRDRNRIALQSGILGSYLNDIRNYLFVTGDPIARADRDNTSAVFDFNSIKCMAYMKRLNESLFIDDNIYYGGALNQDGSNLKVIANRMKKKMEEGCGYFLTQPVYTDESIDNLKQLKELTDAKILVGILPLVSYRNALFMKNEMPGISVSDEVVALYKEDAGREEWEKVSLEFSLKMMDKCKDLGAGYYMMTPFNRASLIKKIQENF